MMNKKCMKQILAVLLSVAMALTMVSVVGFAAEGDVAVNETNFPDAKFRAYVQTLPGAEDDVLTAGELAKIKEIRVRNKYDTPDDAKISDLTGIEHFTSLMHLDCTYNLLTELDVTKLTSLKFLLCGDNRLASLDVSKNTQLTDLVCGSNQLTELNVSALTNLEYLDCYDNLLTTLDVSKNTLLDYLDCDGNRLTTLDVSKNTLLEDLLCYGNQLTSLDVSKNVLIRDLECDRNQLTELDVSMLSDLEYLDCYENQLTFLDVSKNLQLVDLDCDENRLVSLDITKNTKLNPGNLYCYDQARVVAAGTELTALPGFKAENAEVTSGGDFEGGTVNYNANSDRIVYLYQVGQEQNFVFTMWRGAEITFKVENGTWDGKNKKDLVVIIPFEGGKDAKGTLAAEDVPQGMKPAEGFEGGAWDVVPNTEENGISGSVTYTYRFTEKVEVPSTEESSSEAPSTEAPSGEESSAEAPSAENPSTGGSSTGSGSTALWILLGFVSVCGAAIVLRKKRAEQ